MPIKTVQFCFGRCGILQNDLFSTTVRQKGPKTFRAVAFLWTAISIDFFVRFASHNGSSFSRTEVFFRDRVSLNPNVTARYHVLRAYDRTSATRVNSCGALF